ncbi:MAG: hypothetical protein Q7S56_00360 [Nanoarchaeota archaeon]|nr:hypothetical protein [Nanoarchaeota archaeon]
MENNDLTIILLVILVSAFLMFEITGGNYGMMRMMYGYGFYGLASIFNLLFTVIIVVIIILLIQKLQKPKRRRR